MYIVTSLDIGATRQGTTSQPQQCATTVDSGDTRQGRPLKKGSKEREKVRGVMKGQGSSKHERMR